MHCIQLSQGWYLLRYTPWVEGLGVVLLASSSAGTGEPDLEHFRKRDLREDVRDSDAQ